MTGLFSQNNTLGLDIGSDALKLVELKPDGNGFAVVSSIDLPISERIIEKDLFKDKEMTVKIIKETCQKAKPVEIRAKKLVTALPETYIFSKVIQLPKMRPGEYEKAVPLEAAQTLPIPIEETCIDYQILSQHPDSSLVDILLVAAPKRLVDEYLEVTKMAGLDLVAIETKPLASGRAILTDKDNSGLAIIEIGTEVSRVSIWEERNIRLTTTIGVGKNQIDTSLADDEEPYKIGNLEQSEILAQISKELLEVIKYHQNRDYKPRPVEKIYLCGSGGKIANLAAYLTDKVKIKCEIGKPNVAGKIQLGTEFAIAAGLAMRKE